MSMPSKQKGWLWGSLGYACPLEAGRTALVSVGRGQALASLFRTISETGRTIDILTASTAFPCWVPRRDEPLVRSVGERSINSRGHYEYQTTWEDSDVTYQLASSFMDADGTLDRKSTRLNSSH